MEFNNKLNKLYKIKQKLVFKKLDKNKELQAAINKVNNFEYDDLQEITILMGSISNQEIVLKLEVAIMDSVQQENDKIIKKEFTIPMNDFVNYLIGGCI